MDSSSIVAQVYKGRQTLLSQLKAQGYVTDELDYYSVSDVNLMLKHDQLDFMVETPAGQKAMVKFYLAKALRPANVAEFVEQYFDVEQVLGKDDMLYIVTNADPNDTLLKTINNLWLRSQRFVVINGLPRLQFDITTHKKVPKHVVLSDAESLEVRKKYGILRDDQLPSISRFDPAAVAFGLRPGQICRIHRPSPTAISSVYYRLCVDM
jgi:DNA-directed RNA polymerase subunit H (RpoH/RPB5)